MPGIRRRTRAPWRLVYRHAASGTASATMDLLLDLLQGAGLAAAIGIRPFLPVLLAGALASADLGIDFEGTDFAFLEEWPFLLGVLVARRWCSTSPAAARARRRGAAAAARTPLLGAGARPRRAAGRRLARRPQPDWWAGRVVGAACAALWASTPRARCSRACAAGSTPRRPPRCRSTPRAPRSVAAGLSILVPAARVLIVARRLRVAARRRPPPRGREVRRPADPALSAVAPQEARPRRHRRDEARDARAGGRGRAARRRSSC